MAYIKTDWEDGDVITEAGLDHLETGVYNNSVAIGDLSELDTTAKANLVAAINEAAQSGGGGGGMSNAVKDALLQIASKVAYIDADGQDYYDDLYDALYPAAAIVSINAEYTQTGTVYTTTSLDDLRNDLVVTAIYDNGSVVPVITYTLSGSLTVGTSTITATYSGFTDTFTVTVSAAPTVSSISAVYTQSGTVYDTDSLDSLKADLVVTATYSDSSTATVPSADYTLSGTLTVGTSTITVTYESKTTTFNVTVTEHGATYLYNWDFTQSLVDSVNGKTLTLSGDASRDSTGLHFTSESGYVELTDLNVPGYCFELDITSFDRQGTSHGRLFTISQSGVVSSGFIFHNTGVWAIYSKGTSAWVDSNVQATGLNGKTVTVKLLTNPDETSPIKTWMYVYVDGTLITSASMNGSTTANAYLGSNNGQVSYNMTITGLRVYQEA